MNGRNIKLDCSKVILFHRLITHLLFIISASEDFKRDIAYTVSSIKTTVEKIYYQNYRNCVIDQICKPHFVATDGSAYRQS